MTIVEAAKKILSENEAMSSKEVYEEIVRRGLYEFPAKNPQAVVNGMIRRHCLQLNFPTSSPVKYFSIASKEGRSLKYSLLDEKKRIKDNPQIRNVAMQSEKEILP